MLYLASVSPRRAKLLREAGVPFKKLKTDYRERDSSQPRPAGLVKKHALGKALAAARKIKNGKILAADTVVYFRGKIIGKPSGRHDAFKTLSRLAGNWHTVYTGVAFLEVLGRRVLRRRLFCEKTDVLLKRMDPKGIRAYFSRMSPLDKAGSYAIQQSCGGVVERMRGSFSNAVGLPMERLKFL